MAASIYISNLDPNQKWFARLSAITSEESIVDSNDDVLIELFNSQSDAEASINRVAYGSFSFGAAVRATLTDDSEEPEIGLFNPNDTWHLRVTFTEGDEDTIREFGPMTDLDEVIDPLLVTDVMCDARAKLEVDKATHLKTTRALALATHIQELECLPTGDKRNLTDNMRGLDQQVRVDEIRIHGDRNSLLNTLTVVEFKDLER